MDGAASTIVMKYSLVVTCRCAVITGINVISDVIAAGLAASDVVICNCDSCNEHFLIFGNHVCATVE